MTLMMLSSVPQLDLEGTSGFSVRPIVDSQLYYIQEKELISFLFQIQPLTAFLTGHLI